MNRLNTIDSSNYFSRGGPLPFAGSLRFTNSNNRYIQSQSTTTSANLGSGDFTIEFWLNMNTFTGNNIVDFPSAGRTLTYNGFPIINYLPSTSGPVGGWYIMYLGGDQGIQFFSNVDGLDNISISNVTDIQSSSWIHVAFVRSGTSMLAYLNGSRIDIRTGASPVVNYNMPVGTPAYLCMGRRNFYTAITEATQATYSTEIAGVRLSTVARYTGTTYTVPTTRFISDASTKLLFNFNDSATHLQGTTGVNNTLAVTMASGGGSTWSSTHYPPSNLSNDLPLSGSAQFVPATTTAQLNSGTWNGSIQGIGFSPSAGHALTIEMWIKTTNRDVNNQGFFGYGVSSLNYTITVGWNSVLANQGRVSFGTFNGATPLNLFVQSTTILENDTWYHVAVTRSATDNRYRLFINGVYEALASTANNASLCNLNYWCLGRRQAATDAYGVASGSKVTGFRVSSIDRYPVGSTPIGQSVFTPYTTQLNSFKTYNTSNLNYILTCDFFDVNNVQNINGANVPLVINGYASNVVSSVYTTDVPV